EIDYDIESIDQIVEKIEYAIEQHPSFLKVISKRDLLENESLNKKRDW
ncbi:MAG: 1-acyl-sn-glycerol-3-phosphate acyltransferase, partial [Flavobacteriaceae bacterium]|nr:1-acyl-sn-glycerol-3-phosphate acyltransferase [Flavobacteriaceae bacterium]